MFFKETNYAKLIQFCTGKWPHCFAGFLLLLFAASHFLMLTVDDLSQHSISTVFPFLTMWTLYLLAGIFELATAITCLRNRAQDIANLAIFIFVGVMVWYRWSLSYTGGGKICHCLGILGQTLRLSQTQEKVIPIVALVLLSLTILPWLLSRLVEIVRSLWGNSIAARNVAFILLVFLCHRSYGQQTIEVTGQYDSYHYYDLRTSAPYTNETRHVAFACTFSGNAWSIYATNIDTNPEGAGLRTPWEGLIYDGTNTYTMMPYHVEVMGRSWTAETEMGKSCSIRTTISSGPLFIRDYDEFLDFYTIWLAYGLCPTNLPTDFIKDGAVEIPLPWFNSRNSPMSHGFEWKITPSADRRFVLGCQVLRNTNLDLSDSQEMLRPDFNAPLSLGLLNRDTELLQLRRQIYHQDSVQAIYKCKEWYETNQVLLPMVSEEAFADSIVDTNQPTTQAQVRVAKVTVRKGLEQLLPRVTQHIFVRDYRDRKVDKQKGGISPYIEYLLAPGDSWDNPEILLKAESHRVYFPTDFGSSDARRKSYFAWLLLILILAPLVFFLKPKLATKTKNKQIK
jgi:hypothetical protein